MQPLVRPTGNPVEVDLLPPYVDSEVNLVGEAGISAATDILLSAVGESLDE